MGDNIVIEYITAQGERFATLTNADFRTIANLPWLTDINIPAGLLMFDYGLGTVLSSPVYSLEDLEVIAAARSD